VNTAGWVFGTAALGVVEGFVEAVEVLFRPSGPELALVGPFDAVPAVAATEDTSGMARF